MSDDKTKGTTIDTHEFAPEQLFSVPLWSRAVLDHETVNQYILSLLPQIEKATTASQRSNVGGWHSAPNLHLNNDFAQIRQIIGTTCVQCATSLNYDFENFDIAFNEMWLNRNGPGDYNRAHIHSHAIFSGVYYIKVPPQSGNIELYDPIRERAMMAVPVKQAMPRTGQTLEVEGEEGKLLIFPSWLQHAVQANRSDEDRVSLSFNMISQPKTPTAK